MKSLIQPCYDKDGKVHPEPRRLHHMRFLYRAMCFRERYGENGFSLCTSNMEEVDSFEKLYKDALDEGKLCITMPEQASDLKGYKKDEDKIVWKGDVSENHLEKWFVFHAVNQTLPKCVIDKFKGKELYDQLPCGMFYDEKSSLNRIFNSGAFDLWGVNDDGELCVFELKKKGNEKLGIISELFFYAMLMRDMKKVSKGKFDNIKTNHRGFQTFVNNEKSDNINAYFLVPKLHSFLEDKDVSQAFISVLNEVTDGIKFNLIKFSQENDIIKNGKDEFFDNLVKDWKKYKTDKQNKVNI